MKKRLIRILALIGAISIISAVAGLVAGFLESRRVDEGTIVTVDFEAPIVEQEPPVSLVNLTAPRHLTTRDVVDGLRRAATDPRITGVLARVGGVEMGLAQMQEIRDAIAAFRESGKRSIAFAETFGEFGPGTGSYYLASAFEEVWLQPSGDVSLTGVIVETPFVRGALEKLGIEPRFDARREYKSAMNVLTERDYTAPHRKASRAILHSHFEQITHGIAADRDVEVGAVQALVDRAPIPADEALEVGLVDHLGYHDQLWDALAGGGEQPPDLGLGTYLARVGRPDHAGERVALIYGVGNVHRGKSSSGFYSGEPSMGSDTIAGAFREAVDDEKVRAIVFRVDSPGGSYIASDVIWREVGRARRHGKPVVVSMSNVAGSGGYFVAVSADAIVAQPATITGSIGVLAGKLITDEFWERLGVNWGELHEGDHATMWSASQDYSPSEWHRFQTFLDRIYSDFKAKVGEGRGLDDDEVERVARGRVWTGAQAVENGLVDDLGGLGRAFALVREHLGLEPDAPLDVVELPTEPPLAEQLLERLLAAGMAKTGGAETLLAPLRRMPEMARVLRALDETGPLSMPWPTPVWR
jgi:protease-4